MQAISPFIEEIKNRRSVRSYDSRPVQEGIVSKILEAGRYAPSSLNRQPWKFIVISDRGVIKRLSEAITRKIRVIVFLYPVLRVIVKKLRDKKNEGALRKTAASKGDAVFYGAPLLICVTAPKGDSSAARDCMLASQNMMLAASSIGLGSCFIGRMELIKSMPRMLAQIGLPKDREIISAIVFGYAKGGMIPAPPRHGGDVITWIK